MNVLIVEFICCYDWIPMFVD